MSGGSYNYAFENIERLAHDITNLTPLRKAFKKHLRLVATACRDIEWVDSCDTSPGDEDSAILKCLGKQADQEMLLAVTESLEEQMRMARTALEYIKENIKQKTKKV